MSISQAVILAGGLGTRLMPFTKDNPKPMIPIEGQPFLSYLLCQIGSWGIENVVLLLGYKAEKIEEYFGDGKEFGVKITYCVTPTEYDTGARIRAAQEYLQEEFILLYCDNYCPIDFGKACQLFEEKNNLVQVTAYANKDAYTKNNLTIKDGQVVVYDKKRQMDNLQAVDIGYIFIKKQVLEWMPEGNVNFESTVYPKIIGNGKMGIYLTEHRYYSIGSWERIELTKEFFKPKKVIFLDRDGTLNVRPPKACYVEKEEDFIWLPKAREAVKMLKDKGYTIYIITNQPGLARGNLTWEMLEAVHGKMRKELQEIGVDVDGIYLCPHGWNDGCDCRKPRPGMLYQAQKEHSLDLTKCFLIGDDERDIQAGKAAGLSKNILLAGNYSLWDAACEL